ncbi:MAG: hypothetical protein P8Z49_03015 [Acidobacteriota bacterium]|jgi:hypothetical protein
MNAGAGLAAALFAGALLCVCCSSGSDAAREAVPPLKAEIAQVRGDSAEQWIGKRVVVEGFYYGETIPMILDDINRAYIDVLMPKESYLPILGPVPDHLKTGDRVAVTGMIDRPGPADSLDLASEKIVIRISDGRDIHILEGVME